MAQKKKSTGKKDSKEENKDEFDALSGQEWSEDDENFGLPDIEYTPLDRDEEQGDEGEKKEKKVAKKSTKKTAGKEKKTTVKKAAEKKEEKSEEKKATKEEVTKEEPKAVETEDKKEEKPKEEKAPARKIPAVSKPKKSDEPNFSYDSPGEEEIDSDETTAEDFELEYEEVTAPPPVVKKEEEKRSMAPILITIILLVVIIGAALSWIFYFEPKQEEENYTTAINEGTQALSSGLYDEAIAAFNRAKEVRPDEVYPDEMITKVNQAKLAFDTKRKQEEEAARLAEEKRLEEERLAAEAAKGATPGTVEVLTERTSNYYVVVASTIDEDLAMDFANRISKNGVGVQILSPVGNVPYHRVTIAKRDTFNEAQEQADQLKAEYKGAWVVKY